MLEGLCFYSFNLLALNVVADHEFFFYCKFYLNDMFYKGKKDDRSLTFLPSFEGHSNINEAIEGEELCT